ncbi:hypothetical protein BC828DRAFT_388675, partial [Blastocladiella britannica]
MGPIGSAPPKSREENQRKREHSVIASCAPTRTCAPPQGQPTACSCEAHLSGGRKREKGDAHLPREAIPVNHQASKSTPDLAARQWWV